MKSVSIVVTVVTGLLCGAGVASVATASEPQSSPAGANVTVPAHRSAIEGFRAHRAEPVRPWKESNDAVRRAGGWRVYGREAIPGTVSAPPASPAASHGASSQGASSGAADGSTPLRPAEERRR